MRFLYSLRHTILSYQWVALVLNALILWVNFHTIIQFMFGASALILAASNGHKDIVKALLLAKANPNYVAQVRIPAECYLF